MKRRIHPVLCLIFFLLPLFALVPPIPAASDTWTVGFITGVEKGAQSGFIRMASQGLYRARRDHGFEVITEAPADVSQEAMAAAFQKMADRSPDLIMATGFQMAEHVRAFAPRYPDILFLMNDVPITDLPNVMSVQFAAHESSFLAGVLAARMTRTGKVGVVGGVDIPPVKAFMAGYAAGVRYANPKIEVAEAFISRIPDYSGFILPRKGRDLAGKWFARGVDIIFSVAGSTGNGIIHQARLNDKFAIGVDVDQDAMAKGHVLTSVLKRMDVAVYLAVTQIVTGGFTPGVRRYGLADGGVGLTGMKHTRHLVPESALQELEKLEQKIISGEILVPDHMSEADIQKASAVNPVKGTETN